MRRVFRSILSIAIALIMAVSIVPFKVFLTASAYSYIEYGNYPQSRVTNSSIISALNSKAGLTSSWTSYGYYIGTGNGGGDDGKMTPKDYMRYKDIAYNGAKYRGVYFDTYRPSFTGNTSLSGNSYQDENGYYTGTKYWFKYEPLKWRILDSGMGLVMCENIIDSQAYNNYILSSGSYSYGNASKTYYANNYYYSSIRQWLNNDFYNTAFNKAQKDNIKRTQLDNSCYNPSYTQYNAPSSNDKIFLLSYNDAKNSTYGFSSSSLTYDIARRAKGTDYAKCQGLHVYTSGGYSGNSYWWLRSSYDNSGYAFVVNLEGHSEIFSGVSHTNGGIRPACCLSNLKSDTSENPDIPSLTDPCNVTLKKVNGKWYCYTDDKINYTYVGLAKNDYGWWYVKNGTIDFTYTGLAKNQYGWFYVKNGKLDTTYTGLAKNEYGWFYVKNGKLDTSYTGLAKNEYGWFYVKNGKLDTSYTGLAKNQYGWWYVKNGKLDTSYTGLAKNQYGWWYVKNGKLDTSYTGYAKNEYGWFYVKNGKVVN